MALIKIPTTKNKISRSFTVQNEFYKIMKNYQDLRPKNAKTRRFFLNYRNSKCTCQVIGKNKFGKMPEQIARYLQLPNPNEYTGHSFRRTSATLLADAGANITTLKRHGGWRSDKVAEGYVEQSINNKIDINNQITKSINLTNSTNENIVNSPPEKIIKTASTVDYDSHDTPSKSNMNHGDNEDLQEISGDEIIQNKHFDIQFTNSTITNSTIKIYIQK